MSFWKFSIKRHIKFALILLTIIVVLSLYFVHVKVKQWRFIEEFRSKEEVDMDLYIPFKNGNKFQIFNMVPMGRTEKVESIGSRLAIVIVLAQNTNPNLYSHAIDSVRCYSQIHGYSFVLAVDSDYDCTNGDKFFRRHCVVAKILPKYDVVLFLDADIGVVNPNRKIEEFIEDGIDVTFYNRFFDWEIALGSYIVRNTKFANDLLIDFANYESKLPHSFHGSDNGALHMFLAERLFPEASIEIDLCRIVYEKSKDYDDLFIYEACIRTIFGAASYFGKIRIMKKGTGWVRDGWLTSMLWHPDVDFMFHGLKSKSLRNTPEGPIDLTQTDNSIWYNPLAGPIHLEKCHPNNSTWNYNPKLMGDEEVILNSLRKLEREVTLQQIETFSRIMEVWAR